MRSAFSPPWIQTSTQTWTQIIDTLRDAVLVLHETGGLLFVNQAGERLFDASFAHLKTCLPEKLFRNNTHLWREVEKAFLEKQRILLREVPWVLKLHEDRIVDLEIAPVLDQESTDLIWLLHIRDVTPFKSMEEEVRKTDRLDLLGTIAAGLAHEIRNPLGGIHGAAQLLERESTDPESRKLLQVILDETKRVNTLIGKLLSFSKPQSAKKMDINLNEISERILLLEKGNLQSQQIQVRREYDPSLPPVSGDPDQMTQVVLNLVRNAMEAMPMEGKGKKILVVRTRMRSDLKIRSSGERQARALVTLEIQDHGIGMDEETKRRIFTPFFTTKAHGTGLGLPMCQRIIAEHGGFLQVESHAGEGSCFRLCFRRSHGT